MQGMNGLQKFFPSMYRGTELKLYTGNLSASFSSVTSSGVALPLCQALAEGTSYGSRIGRVVRIHDIMLYGTLTGGQTNIATDDKYNTVRIVISKTLQNGATGYPSASALNTPPVPQLTQGIIKFLADRTMILATPGRDSTGYLPAVREVAMIAHVNELVRFYGSGAAVVNGYEYQISMTTDSGLPSNPGFVNGYYAITFTDA